MQYLECDIHTSYYSKSTIDLAIVIVWTIYTLMMFEEVFMVDFHQNTYNRLNFYVEEQVYWAPASMTSDLYAQLALKKYREISRNQIKSVSKSQISCAYRPFFYTVES